jgi:ABC-type bacteriocin/lantibiotic exporter with double-glycine peptidase domain
MLALLCRRRAPRVRYIPQLEVTECGAASLAMVLDAHGASVPLVELREACAVGRDGVSAARLVKVAREYGLDAKGVRVDTAQLAQLPLPAILHWELNHFLVLQRITRDGGAWLVDPASGLRRVSRAELAQSFSGVALIFARTPALVRRTRRSPGLLRYRKALARHRGALGLMFGAAALLELTAVLAPATVQFMIDQVVVPLRHHWWWPAVLACAGASLATLLLTGVRDRVIRRLQFAVDLSLVAEFVEHLVTLPLPFFQQRTAGDLLARADTQRQLRELALKGVVSVLDGLLVLTFGALMLAYHARLGACVLALSALRVVVLLLFRARMTQVVTTEQAQQGREMAAQIDALSVPEVVKAFAAEHTLLARFETALTDRLATTIERERLASAASQLGSLLDGITQATVLWLGGRAVIDHQISLGILAGFATLQASFQRPLEALVNALLELGYARAALARIDDVLETRPLPRGELPVLGLRKGLTFERVSFRYGPTSPWVCEDLSFELGVGEKIAIVGRSGQGKSTFLKLLLGVLEPTSGRILVDGIDLRNIDRSAFLRKVGVVLQESFFFDDSVRANLTLCDEHVDPDTMHWAARVACIDDVIANLPQGFDTPLGENAQRLSGGQRQRLALARALCQRPSLLVLDEATSSLDRETEAAIHHNLSSVLATRVIVAHRLSTVRDAQRILVFEGGRIVQMGSYPELMESPGLLQQLACAAT